MGRLTPKVLSLAPLRALFAWRLRRYADVRIRSRLAEIGRAFVAGYSAALEASDLHEISRRHSQVAPELQGFAAEGIGMGLALLDCLAPVSAPDSEGRLRRFAGGYGRGQAYLLHVGAGWALAFPFVSPRSLMRRLEPAFRELALDGYGFYRAWFLPRSTVRRHRLPAWLGADRPAFDLGIGRRLWLLDSPGIEPIVAAARAFPENRLPDLWAGLGEACAFSGVRSGMAAEMAARAGPLLPCFAEGIAFAAEVRDRGGNPAAHTEEACRAVWSRGAAETAALVRSLAPPLDGTRPAPLTDWRRRLRARFTALRGALQPYA